MATSKGKARRGRGGNGKPVTLKDLGEHLGLSPATISVVLNGSPVADSIPEETQERIFAAARRFNYRPNQLARSLRRQRSFSVGVLVPEIGEGFSPAVMSGVEHHLLQEGYFYLVASHRWKSDLLEEYLALLADRAVEGFLLLNTPIVRSPALPTVAVAPHQILPGVTNVVIDNDLAAHQALAHLAGLGHRRIAFFKGHPHSADTERRWRAIEKAAGEVGVEVRPELTLQLTAAGSGEFSTEEGYREGHAFGTRLLERTRDFTALFAFNDVSAIGAIRAFLDAGLRVPDDVSVVGFDDVQSAAFLNPSLTTVRQPMAEMGATAGRLLLARLAGESDQPEVVTVEPELMVRGSTGPPAAKPRPRRPAGRGSVAGTPR